MINLETLRRLKRRPNIRPYSNEVLSGTKTEFSVLGYVHLDISFGNQPQQHPVKFIVVSELAVNILLSNIALQSIKAVISPGDRKLEVNGVTHPLISGQIDTCTMVAAEEYNIKPGCSQFIKLAPSTQDRTGNGEFILTPEEYLSPHACEQLISRDPSKKATYMLIKNAGSKPLNIQ